MGCKTSICNESELYLTQELHKEPLEKCSGLLVTESTDRFTGLRSTLSTLCRDNLQYQKLCSDWFSELAFYIDENTLSPEDYKNTVTLSSDLQELYIKHELSFIKNFAPVRSFAKKHCPNFSDSHFSELENLILSLRPISSYIYLKLGKKCDCGMGIEKALDPSQMQKILNFTEEKESISLWANGLIPTGVSFSAFTPSRHIQFYIFDGHKAQNYLKALSLFEFFAGPIDKDMKDQIFLCKSQAVTAMIGMNTRKVIELGLELHCPDQFWSLANVLGQNTVHAMVRALQAQLTPLSVGVNLTSDGLGIFETCGF